MKRRRAKQPRKDKNACLSRLLRSSFHSKSQVCHVTGAAAAAATNPEHTHTHAISYLLHSLKNIWANIFRVIIPFQWRRRCIKLKKKKQKMKQIPCASHAKTSSKMSCRSLRIRATASAFYARKQTQRHHVFILF